MSATPIAIGFYEPSVVVTVAVGVIDGVGEVVCVGVRLGVRVCVVVHVGVRV